MFATADGLTARGDYVAGEVAGYPIFVAVV